MPIQEPKSWIAKNVRAVAEMVSYCPAFWEICGIAYTDAATDYATAQPAARLRTKESNVLYFIAEAEPETEPAAKRGRKQRQDWIDARPLATVMHDTEVFGMYNRGTGIFVPHGIIDVVIEKNAYDENRQLLGNADMPSEQACNDWIDQICNLEEELHQISSMNRIPYTNIAYPHNRIPIVESDIGIPPQFTGIELNRIYGAHFIGSLHLRYETK